jgi:hypothetical protein
MDFFHLLLGSGVLRHDTQLANRYEHERGD